MITSFLFTTTYAAQALPVLQDCPYYNTYEYSCIDALPTTNTTQQTFTQIRSITTFDMENKRSASLNTNYQTMLNDNYLYCLNDNSNYPACNSIASACALSSYYPLSSACKAFKTLFPDTNQQRFADYQYWPLNQPFIEYGATPNQVLNETILTTDISKDTLTFMLARYANNGTFLGYMKMTDEFIRCTENKSGNKFWRIFGTQFRSECIIDLEALMSTATTDLFEPFVVDGTGATPVIRPVPIKLLTYRDSDDVAVNQQTIERKQRVFRRFFVYDNYTNNIFIQYLSRMTLIFTSQTDSDVPKTPLIEIAYNSVRRANLETVSVPLIASNESIITPLYTFNTLYDRNMQSWSNALTIVGIILGVIALIFWLFRIFVVVRRYGEDGIDFYVLLAIITELVSIGAYLIYIIAFIFSFAVLVAYKWQSGSYSSISGDFSLLTPAVWLAFALSLVAAFLKTIMQFHSDVFFIDWEPRTQGVPVSAWRRIFMANEWVRLLQHRSYSLPFTLIVMLFILNGFDAKLMGTGAPTSKLIDTGETLPILRFGFTAFVFMLFLFAEWIFFTVIDAIFGSKFDDFVRLCRTSNISVLALVSRSWGYYIHGRSNTAADDGDAKLTDSVANEELTKTANIKNIDGTDKVVFEVFLAEDFRDPFTQAYTRVIEAAYHTPRNLRSSNTSSISPEQMASFDQLNTFLQRFFGADEEHREFTVQSRPISYTVLRVPPSPEEKSVLYAEPNVSLKIGLFGRSEWLVALMDILFFCGIDYELNNAPIAAFCTLICDAVIMALLRQLARSNLAKKALLDHRFIIE